MRLIPRINLPRKAKRSNLALPQFSSALRDQEHGVGPVRGDIKPQQLEFMKQRALLNLQGRKQPIGLHLNAQGQSAYWTEYDIAEAKRAIAEWEKSDDAYLIKNVTYVAESTESDVAEQGVHALGVRGHVDGSCYG